MSWTGIEPECDEQLHRINSWKGGETKALELFQYRKVLESEVNTFFSLTIS